MSTVSLVHSIGAQVEEQLKKAPENPSFLFEDSYLPEMNSISKKELKKLSKPDYSRRHRDSRYN